MSDALENTGASPATVDKAAGSLCAVLKEIDRRGPALSERVTAAAEEVSRILEGGYREKSGEWQTGILHGHAVTLCLALQAQFGAEADAAGWPEPPTPLTRPPRYTSGSSTGGAIRTRRCRIGVSTARSSARLKRSMSLMTRCAASSP